MGDQVKRAIDQYDKIAARYAQKIAPRLRKENLEQLTSYLEPHASIIDLGCSAGRDCRYFKDKGFNAIGIDLSKNLLDIARKNNPEIKFIQCDVRQLPFSDNYFQGMWANAVFHHLEKKDMIDALIEWKRVLKENGILYLRTKMGKGQWKGEDELSVGELREFTLLSKNELSEMIKKTGFKKISLEIGKDSTRDILWLIGLFRK